MKNITSRESYLKESALNEAKHADMSGKKVKIKPNRAFQYKNGNSDKAVSKKGMYSGTVTGPCKKWPNSYWVEINDGPHATGRRVMVKRNDMIEVDDQEEVVVNESLLNEATIKEYSKMLGGKFNKGAMMMIQAFLNYSLGTVKSDDEMRQLADEIGKELADTMKDFAML